MSDTAVKPRVLLVEDEMLVAMITEEVLVELGFEVVGPAANVKQALEMIEAGGPLDAAVLDLNLNGDNSYPVADTLAERAVPFAFVTGYGRKILASDYAKCAFLQKPYTVQELEGLLSGLLAQKNG